ncbi:hypothetical protein AM593_06783, partial [Mytilus galloprovincialis]
MATVAMLEIPTSKVSCRLDSPQSYKVSLILAHFEIFEIFDILSGSYGNRDHSKNFNNRCHIGIWEGTYRQSFMDLTYHFKKSNPAGKNQSPKCTMNFNLAEVTPKDDGLRFVVTASNGRTLKLKAQGKEERNEWIKFFKIINEKQSRVSFSS